MRRQRSICQKLAFTAVFTLLLLGVAECGVRAVGLARGVPFLDVAGERGQLIYTRHPFLGTTIRPNQTMRMRDGVGVVTVSSSGYRGAEVPLEAPPGVRRVVTLGGSVVFGTGASDADTFPARLEVALDAAGAGDWQVINAGVPGFTSAESLVRFALQASDYRPDYTILYQAYNDLKMIDPRPSRFRSDYTHIKGTLAEKSLGDRLFGWSRLYRKLRETLLLRTPAVSFVSEAGGAMGPTAGASETFRRNVTEIVAMAEARGSRPVLSTFAMPLSDEVLEAHPDLDAWVRSFVPNLSFTGLKVALAEYNGILRRVAEERGIPILDGAALLSGDGDNFIDHCHLSPLGAERLGRAFAELIEADLAARAGAELSASEP